MSGMGLKSKAAVVVGVVALAFGGLAALEPPKNAAELQEQQLQQQLEDLQDANEREQQRYEDDADALRRAEEARRAAPGEHRPTLPRLPLPGKG